MEASLIGEAERALRRAEHTAALGSMVAGVAHELNTPLGNCVTMISTLQEAIACLHEELHAERPRRSRLDAAASRLADGMDLLLRNVERAADVVTNFKQVAVDQSSDQRGRFNLRQTIPDMVRLLESGYRGSAYRLTVDPLPDLWMDSFPAALVSILTHLVNNAVQHGFSGRDAGAMRLHIDADHDGKVLFIFHDDGQGIPAALQARVFDPFFTTRLGQGSAGLGLHIVQRLVSEVLGGSITLSSETGQGTTLAICVPAHAPALH
jgi:signal transduction histidine kinase